MCLRWSAGSLLWCSRSPHKRSCLYARRPSRLRVRQSGGPIPAITLARLLAVGVAGDITNLNCKVVAAANDKLGTQRHAPYEVFVSPTSGQRLRRLAWACRVTTCFAYDPSPHLRDDWWLLIRRRRSRPSLQCRNVQESDVLIGRSRQNERVTEVDGSDPIIRDNQRYSLCSNLAEPSATRADEQRTYPRR